MITVQHLGKNRFVIATPGLGGMVQVRLASPWDAARGASWSGLRRELDWYFADYHRCADHRAPARAGTIEEAVRRWGEDAFGRLFSAGTAAVELDRARVAGTLLVRIEAGDPEILSWPWEALRGPGDPAALGTIARMERSVPGVPAVVARLGAPREPLRVLMVSPRAGPGDVDYRAVSGPLVHAVESLPVSVSLLRPATYGALQQALHEQRPDVLHIDGHGQPGLLWFEDGRGGLDPVPAGTLAALLRPHNLPVVVLNACRSAQFRTGGVYSGTATELLRGSVGSVVAMTHPLHRDGAASFVPAFYTTLAQTGDVALATMAGRFQMLQNPWRFGVVQDVRLDDHLLPVLYQRSREERPAPHRLPAPPPSADAPGALGRDEIVMEVERSLASGVPTVFLRGEALSGKSLVAGDLARWLRRTGYPKRVVEVSLGSISSGGELLNHLGLEFGQSFFGLDRPAKVASLARAKALWILDGFGAAVHGDVAPAIQELVCSLGPDPRLLLTGRALPEWLPLGRVRVIELPPLDEAGRREFAHRLLTRHRLDSYRGDPDFEALVSDLGGSAGLMAELVPRLPRYGSASELLDAWRRARAAAPADLRRALEEL